MLLQALQLSGRVASETQRLEQALQARQAASSREVDEAHHEAERLREAQKEYLTSIQV